MKPAPIQRDPNTRNIYKGNKPMLKITERKKRAKDFAETKNVMDFYIESTFFSDQYNTTSGNYRDIYMLYDAYNNKIPESYFAYVTNPLSSTKKEHSNYPARIRPYSILRPNIDLLLGEFDKRQKKYTVVVTNSDSANIMEDLLYQAVLNNLQSRFVSQINEQDNPDQPQDQQETPQEVKDKFTSNYKDERAMWGQDTLERLDNELQVNEQFARMFKDYCIAGEVYSAKGVEKGNMFYERVSPLDIDYDKSPDNEYIEDASWIVRRKFMTPSDVVNLFYDELKSKHIDVLEEHDATLPFHSTYFNSLFGNSYRNEEDLRRAKVVVYHTVWRYYKKIGFITILNPMTGEVETAEVDETYKKSGKELTLDWVWVTEFWEGYRIDTPNITSNPAATTDGGEIIYTGIQPIPYQRTKLNGFSQNKNPYNGIRFSATHSRNISILELGLPYQILYMILHYRLELTIAKSKGKILLLDKNVIPNTKGWDEEKFFYWAEANSFALIDRSQRGVDKQMNQYSAIDMGLYQHIDNLIKIMEFVKMSWDQVIGITPQRKGMVAASETASGIDTARYQSSVISERVFSSFDEFMRRERAGLLDVSKFAYVEGRKAVGYSDDMRSIMMEIDPAVYVEAEFDVHVSNSGQDLQNLEMMKAQAGQLASQGATPSIVAEIIESNNISKLKSILRKAEEREMQAAERRNMAAEDMETQRLKIQESFKELESRFAIMLQDHKYDREEEIEHIKGQYDLADTNTEGDSLDPLALEQTLQDREKLAQEGELKSREIKSKERMNLKDNETKKYVADKSFQVAKENQTKAELKSK